jgi:hypothetical protein
MNACLLALLLVAAPAAASASPASKAAATPATKPAAKSTPTPLAKATSAAASTPANTGQAQPGPPVLVQGRDVVDPSVPSKYKSKIAEAQVQGALLQQEDVAVWVASNALVRSGLKAPTGATPTGWLASPVTAQALLWKVVFTAKQGSRHFSFADIDVDLTAPPPKFRVDGHAAGRDLAGDELALSKAIDAIDARSDWLRCANTYNYSARFVTGGKGREIRVRAIPARNDAKQYLLGGFHEYTIPEKGGKSRHFEQTTTCLELPLPKNGLGFMVTSLNSDTPTLFHVFASLSYQRPVYVKNNSRTWKVDAGKVTVVDKKTLKSVKIQDPPAK